MGDSDGLGYLVERSTGYNYNGGTDQRNFVLDYTSPPKHAIMETVSGMDNHSSRHTYGLQKISGVLTDYDDAKNSRKDFYHHDRIGSIWMHSDAQGSPYLYTITDPWGAYYEASGGDFIEIYAGYAYDNLLHLQLCPIWTM